jgi:hypothetical protein
MPSRYSKIDLIEYKSTQSRWNIQALFRIILHNEIQEEIANRLSCQRNHSKMQSKLPNTGTTIFTVMSALATEHKAVNLSQGFPDFPISDELKNFVKEALDQNQVQYAPMPGRLDLRQEISN